MKTLPVARFVTRSAVHLSVGSLLLGLGGCGYYASRTAHKAQVIMIGMTEEDVQACAGVPAKTQIINSHVKIFEYQRGRNIGAPTSSTLIPVQSVVNIVRDVGGGDGNSCIADFRIVDGTVRDVYYSGDDDMLVGTDGVCSSIVRGCVRRNVPSGSPPDFWKTSAFLQPQPEKSSGASAPVSPATDGISGNAAAPAATRPGGLASRPAPLAPPLAEPTLAAPAALPGTTTPVTSPVTTPAETAPVTPTPTVTTTTTASPGMSPAVTPAASGTGPASAPTSASGTTPANPASAPVATPSVTHTTVTPAGVSAPQETAVPQN
nr:hypothetical protein [Acetobacter persici]